MTTMVSTFERSARVVASAGAPGAVTRDLSAHEAAPTARTRTMRERHGRKYAGAPLWAFLFIHASIKAPSTLRPVLGGVALGGVGLAALEGPGRTDRQRVRVTVL